MLRAVRNGAVLAEAPRTIRLEGNHYFPRIPSTASTSPSANQVGVPWKGLASHDTAVVDGQANPDAAWYYPIPARRPTGSGIT